MTNDQRDGPPLSDDELLRGILNQAEVKRRYGSELSRQGAWEADTARAGLCALPYQATGQQPSPFTDHLSRLYSAQQEQLANLKSWIDAAGTAVNSTAYVNLVTTDLSRPQPQYFQFVAPEQFQEVKADFDGLFERHAKKEEVLQLMCRVKLDKTEYGQSAIRQFRSAWIEHEKAPSTPTASLIPLREAVDLTVDQIFQRRPAYEKDRTPQRERILKIGKHLAALGTSPKDFEELQQEWMELKDAFSASKDKDMSRQEVNRLMRRSTLFLIQFLSAIDPNRLR